MTSPRIAPRARLKVSAVEVPLALLRSKDLTPAAKFLWIRMRLDELRQFAGQAHSPVRLRFPHRVRRLVKRTRIARSTVYVAIEQLAATGWLVPSAGMGSTASLGHDNRSGRLHASEHSTAAAAAAGVGTRAGTAAGPATVSGECAAAGVGNATGASAITDAGTRPPKGDGGRGDLPWRTVWRVDGVSRTVWFPTDLIRFTHALPPQAILFFGLLQTVHGFSTAAKTGSFKWAELRALTGLHVRTLKRAVRALVDALWVSLAQRNRKARIWFRLQHADLAYLEQVRKDLEKAPYRGEALMRSFLSLTADTRECQDHARPEFLVNPATGERLEFDRYYPVDRVAFEFNGPQHYTATGRFTRREVTAQRKRDRVKQRVCNEKGIQLVTVHPEDLSLTGILRKVGDLLPRRALRGLRRTILFLNACGSRYRAAIARACRPVAYRSLNV